MNRAAGNHIEQAITKEGFLSHVKNCLAANFQLEEEVWEAGQQWDLIARYFDVSGRIFITPQDIIDRMETFERVYVRHLERLDEETVRDYFRKLCQMVAELNPGKDHFQTDITGVLISPVVDEEVERVVKKLRFDKTFRFYFRGWCEVRMVCVDLSSGRVMTNPPGKELKKVYTINAKSGASKHF